MGLYVFLAGNSRKSSPTSLAAEQGIDGTLVISSLHNAPG
jgi:hypothetical protein